MKNIKEIVLGLVILGGAVFAASLWIGGNVFAQDDKDSSVTSGKPVESKGSITDLGQMDVEPLNDTASRLKVKRVEAPAAARAPEAAGTNQGSETEPNGSTATADPLTGTDGKIAASLMPTTAVVATNDVDIYSFTTTVANSKLYAATVTFTSGAGNTGVGGAGDTILEVLAPDGTTVIELDDEDGSAGGGNSSSLGGTTLPAIGTYYLRVTNFSTTSPIATYELYFAVRDPATLTAETEPNNNGTPQVLPASQYVSGTIDPVADSDTFTFTAAAGDTVYLALDLDPERNTTTYNGRIGMGLFGTPANFLVSSDSGAFDTIDSEAAFFTVRNAGTYTIYTDSQVAGGGGPTATYNFTISIIPALPAGTCTTYTNAVATPIADLALTTSSISIPDSRIIRSLRVVTDISHTNIPDLDVNLRSPSNNDNGLFTDNGVNTQTGAQVIRLDNEAAVPLVFAILNGVNWRAEPAYNLNWFQGENSLGTWFLDIRDDLAANTGTLNSWSLEVCEEAAVPSGNLIYSENFEAGNGGYTHSGTADEWEYGTPATVGQTVTSPFTAPFTNCASGTNCWKTDLDDTYDASSSQDLVSPNLNLTQYAGTINLYWQQRYQLETISFDRAWVRITEVGNPTNTRLAWNSTNATMSEANGAGASLGNHAESAGWGRYSANISDFAGKVVQITFHLESDSSVNLGGWAIDDVQLRHIGVVAANVPVGGRVLSATGQAVFNARVVLADANGNSRVTYTSPFGYYNFENVQAGRTYTLSASAKRYRFSPVIVTVNDEISGLDIIANPGE